MAGSLAASGGVLYVDESVTVDPLDCGVLFDGVDDGPVQLVTLDPGVLTGWLRARWSPPTRCPRSSPLRSPRALRGLSPLDEHRPGPDWLDTFGPGRLPSPTP